MAVPIYADSFGGLTQANLQQQAQRQAALANSMQLAVSSFQAARQHGLALRQLQYQQDYLKALEEDRKYRRERDVTQDKLDRERFDLSKKELDWRMGQPTAAAVREHDLTFNQADADAMSGTFDSPAHVQQLYPKLSLAEANILAQRSQAARREIGSEYSTAANMAQTLNQHKLLSDRIYQIDDLTTKVNTEKGTSWNPANWAWLNGGNAGSEETLKSLETQKKDTTAQLSRLTPVVDQIRGDKTMRNYVTFDTKAGRFVPTVPQPRWMTPPVATPAPGPGPIYGPPAPGPTAGTGTTATPPPPSTNAPPPNVTPPPATNTGTNAPAGAAPEPTVQMRTRDGNVWNIPQSKVQDALSRGAVVVPPPKQPTHYSDVPPFYWPYGGPAVRRD